MMLNYSGSICDFELGVSEGQKVKRSLLPRTQLSGGNRVLKKRGVAYLEELQTG